MLQRYARFVREQHLDAFVDEELRLLRHFDTPLLRVVAHLSEAELRAMTRASVETFLTALEAGTTVENATQRLRAWEEDKLPGIAQDQIEPSDLVRVYAAQKEALIAFMPPFTQDVEEAATIMRQLDAYYAEVQEAAFQVLVRLRKQSAEKLARAEGEREALAQHASDLQAKNEELQLQAEELESQAEELEQLTEDLRESNSRLAAESARTQATVSSALDAIIMIDHTGQVLEFNPAAETKFGYSRDEAIGRSLSELIVPPDMRQHHDRGMLAYLARGESDMLGRRMEITAQRRDGTLFPVEMAIVRMPVEGPPVFTGFLRDISERREAEARRQEIESMRQADALKDQFLSILSHELRTPINAIMGFGSILDDELAGGLNERQHAYLRKMLGGAETLLALVNDLLDMSRIQAGKFSLDPRPMRLQDTIGDVLTHLAALAEQKGHRLVNEADGALPEIRADVQRVSQVLVNLINNAIKFTPPGGTITVRTRRVDGSLRCEVSDTGPGISHEDQSRLFKPFSQLDGTLTRKVGGTGLGLSISKALIEAHQGAIGVDSEPGVGSTFWFTLPLADTQNQ